MEEEKKFVEETENKNPDLPVKGEMLKMSPKTYDNLVKFGKSLGLIAGSLVTLGAGAIASVAIPVVGNVVGFTTMAAGVWQMTRGIVTATNNLEPSLMFSSKKIGNELTISQDSRLSLASKMKGYNIAEKGGMMQLQALVGFSRYKENFRQTNASYTIDENGMKVYDQKISTVTHSINLKTLDALETLGLIKIDDRETNFKFSGLEALRDIGYDGKSDRRTFLLTEKIGFRNKSGVKNAITGMTSRDPEERKKYSEQLKKYTFRLTDKDIDIADMMLKYQGIIPTESTEEARAINKFGFVLHSKRGILAKKNIDIGKDRFGRAIILYDVDKNFQARTYEERDIDVLKQQAFAEGRKLDMESIRANAKAERENAFDKELREGVDQSKVEAALKVDPKVQVENIVVGNEGKEDKTSQKGDEPIL